MLQKKIDDIQKKIDLLKSQQQEIENDIAHQLLHTIKTHSGFTLPLHVLIGGLIDVIQTCKTHPDKMEEWQTAGEKFLKYRKRPSSRPSSTSPAKVA